MEGVEMYWAATTSCSRRLASSHPIGSFDHYNDDSEKVASSY
jgi:hypothetical protein